MPFYYIDFSTWIVEALNQDQAIIKAQHYLKQGRPYICSVDLAEGDVTKENIEFEIHKEGEKDGKF